MLPTIMLNTFTIQRQSLPQSFSYLINLLSSSHLAGLARSVYFLGASSKEGKQSLSVLLCLFVACSVSLGLRCQRKAANSLALEFEGVNKILVMLGRTYAGPLVVFKKVLLQI
jgi:hypothetical protein